MSVRRVQMSGQVLVRWAWSLMTVTGRAAVVVTIGMLVLFWWVTTTVAFRLLSAANTVLFGGHPGGLEFLVAGVCVATVACGVAGVMTLAGRLLARALRNAGER